MTFTSLEFTNAGSATTNIVGLTDKSQRSYGDEYANIGPVLYAAAFTKNLTGAVTNGGCLGAGNGYKGNDTSNPIDWRASPLESGVVYNVWIDINNQPMADLLGDIFTVYIQQEGGTPRTVLFQDYSSDRDAVYIDPVLGARCRPWINWSSWVIAAPAAPSSTTSISAPRATIPLCRSRTRPPPAARDAQCQMVGEPG